MTVGTAEKFSQLPVARRLALIEAAFLLVFAWLLIKLVPCAWWARLLGPTDEMAETVTPVGESDIGQTVRWAVQCAARHLPWDVVCLPQAMAGKWMLARRRIGSTLCIGVRKSRVPARDNTEMHAWLAVDNWASGDDRTGNDYKIIARFGPQRGRHPETG